MSSFGLNLCGGVVDVVDELLRLGIRNKVRLMILAPTKPSEPLQMTCYASRGQAKVRLLPDQRWFGTAIRSQFKVLAGIAINKKDESQSGQIVFSRIKKGKGSEVVIPVTITPTKYGEIIILTF